MSNRKSKLIGGVPLKCNKYSKFTDFILLDLLHMTTKQIDNAVNDLNPAVKALLHSEFADGTTTRIDTETQSTQTPKEVQN